MLFIGKRENVNLERMGELDIIIVRKNPSVSKKEVLSYGILIKKICQRVRVEFLEFPVNYSFLKPMGSINTSSWSRSQEQIEGALSSRKKVCHCRTKVQIGENQVS